MRALSTVALKLAWIRNYNENLERAVDFVDDFDDVAIYFILNQKSLRNRLTVAVLLFNKNP